MKNIIVYTSSINVLEDYIDSLQFFDSIIEIENLDHSTLHDSNNLLFFTQMWFIPLLKNNYLQIENCLDRIFFINVEMLTEKNRSNQVQQLLENRIKILDYSLTNVHIMRKMIECYNIPYPHEIHHLPYQYNNTEVLHFTNHSRKYEYDVGIINAYPNTDSGENTSRRTKIFEKLQQEPTINCLNIIGWGRDRDREISKCRIIVNVHHFDCFNIFEDIRCARLVFANKLIVSEPNLNNDLVDLKEFIHWSEFDDIVSKVKHVLEHFHEYQNELEKTTKENITHIIDNRTQCLNRFLHNIF